MLNRTIDWSIIEKMCAVTDGAARRRPGDATKLLPRVNEQDMSVVRRFQNVRSPLRQPHAIVKIVLARLQSNEAYATNVCTNVTHIN